MRMSKKKWSLATFIILNYIFFIALANILNWETNVATPGGILLIIISVIIAIYYIFVKGFRNKRGDKKE